MDSSDFLIIGGGIIGVCIARELGKRYHGAKIVLIEKEQQCGSHASGRNSGVLHAGFYYSADSLKAKFTRLGNQELTEYCESRDLKINKCGKLVVAKSESELKTLDDLLFRGRQNGVSLQSITEKEAKAIEPRVKTFERALFSPTTSTIDPVQVLTALKEGVEVQTGIRYLQANKDGIETTAGVYKSRFIVNAAGLYAARRRASRPRRRSRRRPGRWAAQS